MSCGVLRCAALHADVSRIRFFTKKNTLLADKWSVAKCAAWKITAMLLIDGSDSQVYKQKLKDAEQAATKKALKQRQALRMSECMCSEPFTRRAHLHIFFILLNP